MSGINVGRVIVGGFVAGVVANVFDFVITSYLLAGELEGMCARLNLHTEPSIWVFVVVDLVWGLLLVFTYAAIRPRFGAGPKTAILSGVLPWLAISLLEAQINAIGITTVTFYVKGVAFYLVSAVVASLIGAALYKEGPELSRGSTV